MKSFFFSQLIESGSTLESRLAYSNPLQRRLGPPLEHTRYSKRGSEPGLLL